VKIAIIGSGIVGQGTGCGLSQLGHEVYYYDTKLQKLNELKQKGNLVCRTLDESILQTDLCFICVPTPYNNGIDLSYLTTATQQISKALKSKKSWYLVVVKSTVIPKTTEEVVKPILDKAKVNFGLCMNPEFLTEINTSWTDDTRFKRDFWCKERLVIGEMDKKSGDILEEIYKPIGAPIFRTDLKTAEMTKYAANMMLATKISYWNELFLVCKELGIDSNKVAEITSKDVRIGIYGTIHGKAYGGSCLVAGTKIRLKNKLINIEDVKVGDEIADGYGYTKVIGISSRMSKLNVKILSRGRSLIGSIDHRHFIVGDDGKLHEKLLGEIKVGDYIFVPKQSTVDNVMVDMGKRPSRRVQWWKDRFIIDHDFARLMGLYIAEGTMSKHPKQYSICWHFGEKEEWLAIEVLGLLLKLGIHGTKKLDTCYGTYGLSKTWRIRCRQRGLKELMLKINVNGTAINKIINLLPNGVAESFIGGWLDGDGCYSNGTITGHSESRELIFIIDTMLLSMGINAVCSPDGKDIRISDRYNVADVCNWTRRFKFDVGRYKTANGYASQTMRRVDNGWGCQVSQVTNIDRQKVYAIETESGRYIANGMLTHNCLPKDIASFTDAFRKTNSLGYAEYPSVLNETRAINDYMEDKYGVRE